MLKQMIMKNKTELKLAALRCWLSRLVACLIQLSLILVGHLIRLPIIVILIGIHHTWFNIGNRGSWMAFVEGVMIGAWSLLLIRVAFGRFYFYSDND